MDISCSIENPTYQAFIVCMGHTGSALSGTNNTPFLSVTTCTINFLIVPTGGVLKLYTVVFTGTSMVFVLNFPFSTFASHVVCGSVLSTTNSPHGFFLALLLDTSPPTDIIMLSYNWCVPVHTCPRYHISLYQMRYEGVPYPYLGYISPLIA